MQVGKSIVKVREPFLEWLFSVVVLLQFYQTVDGNDITTLKNNQMTIIFRANRKAISLNGEETW